MTGRRCLRGGLVLLMLLSWGALAFAADTQQKRAVALTKAGIAKQKAGEHAEALDDFNEAWGYAPHPKILFYKGRSLMALEDYEEARDVYLKLRDNPALKDAQLREAEANLSLCAAELKRTVVHIVVEGLPGARLLVDGKKAGASPLTIPMLNGQHVVRAEMDGHVAAERVLTIAGQEKLEVRLSLTRASSSAPGSRQVAVVRPAPEGGIEPAVIQVAHEADRSSSALGWTTLGAGGVMLVTGAGFLSNYIYLHTRSLGEHEVIEDDQLDLAIGASLTAVGAGLMLTSVFLFPDAEADGARARLLPLPGGGLVFSLSGALP